MARSSRLKAITKEGLDLEKTEDEKEDFEEKKAACENLCKLMKEVPIVKDLTIVVVQLCMLQSTCCSVHQNQHYGKHHQ